ncbi:MAG: Ig-like domain-containing protein [Gemmatimonadota bacterium]
MTAIVVSPPASTAEAGATVAFSADVRDQFGASMSGQAVVWSSSSAGVASVNPSTGVATAVSPGTAAISASSGGKSAAATLTVIPAVIVSIAVSPVTAALVAGQVVQLSADTKDRNGVSLTDRAVSWSTSAPAVASVDAAGKLTAIGGGSALISATSEGVTGSTTVIVSGPPAVLPIITSISPTVLQPGTVLTINGANFDAIAANDVVSIRGYAAPVITATASQLTVTVPCVSSGAANIQVTSSQRKGFVFPTTVSVPQRTLAVGQALVLTDVSCNELTPAQASARYIVSVFSMAQSENTLADFEITGNSAASGPLALAAPVQPATPAALVAAGAEAARDKAHFEHLERDRAILAEGRRLMSLLPPMNRTATVASAAPVLGDTRRFYYTFSSGCNDTTTKIYGKVIYAGTKAIIWEDTTNTLVSSTDPALAGFYQRLGTMFDQDQYDVVTNNFGDPLRRDAVTDNDGHVNMIFSERVNSSGSAAYVTGCDQYPTTVYRASNFGENFYGTVPTSRGSNLSSTAYPDGWFIFMGRTVVHEVKHIASHAARVANGAGFEESWLEEGTARHAEEIWTRQYVHKVQWKGNTLFGSASTNGIFCDFHPENTTCNAADPLRRPGYGMRRHFNEIRNKLQQPWTWSIYGDGAGQSGSVFYQTTWSLVRYAIDRYGVSDAAFLTALVSSRATGLSNLSAVAGVPAEQLLGMWTLALYADDYPGLASPSADIQFPTWNLRSIYQGLNTDPNWSSSFPTPFPITPVALPMGAFTAQRSGLRGGANAYFELSGLALYQLLNVHSLSGGTASPNLRLAIARLQ